MTFADTLRNFAQARDITQPELASIVGVSPRTMFSWLHGKMPSSLKREGVLARLANAPKARKKPRK